MSDLINRQAAISAITNHGGVVDKSVAKRILTQLSSAQPDGDAISRKAAIDAFWKLDAEIRPSAIDAILNMLKGLPSAQPEIIRCKDCKHRISSLYCEAWNNSPGFPCIGDDMFCSLAERRTDEPD